MTQAKIPTTGSRTQLASFIKTFLQDHPDLHLGGEEYFHEERRKHLEVFGIHSISKDKVHPVGAVEFTALRGPHGTIPVRVFHPKACQEKKNKAEAGALIYFHGGGYTVGSVDEFEYGLRLLAEETAISLRRKEENKKPLAAQILLYPEARLLFDTPAASENNSGYYLECNGIFSFADHYLPRGTPPSHRYISPGMQPTEKLGGLPPLSVYTCGFAPLKDVGVEYAHKTESAGNKVVWRHHDNFTHGFLQMTAWSGEATKAVKEIAKDLKKFPNS